MKTDKKNTFIVAYACEPNETSEPGVGWNFSQEISKFMNITLLTRSNNKKSIESVSNDAKINYIYYDLPNYLTILKKKIPFGLQLYYIFWQIGAYKKAKKIINSEKKYDIFHHLTFGMTKMVPPLFMINIPSIWGPIGGGDRIPYHFLKGNGIKPYISEFIYRTLHQVSNYSPFSFMARRSVNAIVFRTNSSLNNFPTNGCKRRYVFSETASTSLEKKDIYKNLDTEFQILCIGRMIQSKGYIFALKGFKDFLDNGGKAKLVFLGKGPEEETLKHYVKENSLEKSVIFKGFLPNSEVKEHLEKAHILLHPSFREGGSWSIMEAMSYGLPTICLDTSGPKDMVTDKCGILIPLGSTTEVVTDISKALFSLTSDKKQYQIFSENAQKRIRLSYNWGNRAQQIHKVYDEVLKVN